MKVHRLIGDTLALLVITIVLANGAQYLYDLLLLMVPWR